MECLLERELLLPASLLEQDSTSPKVSGIQNEIWRENMIQWAFSVVDSFEAPRETVFLFSHILDRFLRHQNMVNAAQSVSHFSNDAHAYQTLAATAFLVAMKLQGSFGLSLFDIVRWSHSGISSQDIVQMGKQLVQTLTWDQPVPTPVRFIFEYIQVFFPSQLSDATRSFWLDEVNYLLELSLHNYMISCQKSSLVALLALWITLNECVIPQHFTDWSTSIHDQVLEHIDICIERRTESRQLITHVYWSLKRIRFSSVNNTQASDRFSWKNQKAHLDFNCLNHIVPFMDSEVDETIPRFSTIGPHASCQSPVVAIIPPDHGQENNLSYD
jgi:hypothetical protein